jgi:hypothetical protein
MNYLKIAVILAIVIDLSSCSSRTPEQQAQDDALHRIVNAKEELEETIIEKANDVRAAEKDLNEEREEARKEVTDKVMELSEEVVDSH